MSGQPSDITDEHSEAEGTAEFRAGRTRWRLVLSGFGLLVVLALAFAWFSRERIADNLIASELAKRGIPASYRIESIGPRQQVLSKVVIGDPEQPDFTAERLVVTIRPRFGVPDIGALRMVRPRLYGTYLKGKLSFGALDPLIFTGSKEPFRLPDLNLTVEDGRGLIESEYGALGVSLKGSGNLRGGFAGQVAATAPDLAYGGCGLGALTAFGRLSVSRERPRFDGPVRLAGLACAKAGLRLAKAGIAVDLSASSSMDQVKGTISPTANGLTWQDYRLASLGGTIKLDWRPEKLAARYEIAGKSLETPQMRAPRVALAGQLRAVDGFSQADLRSEIKGTVASPGAPLLRSLDQLAKDSQGTLVAALARKAGAALRREASGATFAINLTARRRPEGDSVTVPGAVLRGSSGQALAALSRLQLDMGESGPELLAGTFQTGGPGLPRLSGTARLTSAGGLAADLAMAAYSAGDAHLAVPRLALVQRSGRLGFAGEMRMSGAIPGGDARNLVVPLVGDWSERSGLAIARGCARVSFDALRLSGLEIARRSMAICPPRGTAIVRSGPQGLRIAAGAPSLDLAGTLGGTPIRVASGPVGLAWPGNLSARTIDVALGPVRSPSRFRIGSLSARIGSDVAGSFDNATVALDAVPLDLSDMSGRWRYAGGVLSLSDGELRVSDREQVDRFEPLVASGATLRLADNRITANALLREPQSQREVLRTDIRHDLSSGRGSADLFVDALVFDKALQPDTLTHLALGVIANAEGTLRGAGRIDWNEAGVTSNGRFGTDKLDFAAAFGPVTGTSGTIEFTDLLGLVTAPDQTLKVAAINPGIEVNDGLLTYALLPGQILSVKGGRWPFFDGTLRLQPVDIEIGTDHTVRYVLEIEGIDAARFVQRLELGNLAASGTFDGSLPLIFDKDGGRIEEGRLVSRPPGGNVSYVGELTYKDLSPMANYAFDALRSVDYRQMAIQLDGPLDGEIITRVAFDGISQGEGASRNFITKRIAKLPIKFRLNIRAPFMQLVSSMRSLYDPEYIRDPRMLGIVEEAKSRVQTSESDEKP
jgi:hypothetical protein